MATAEIISETPEELKRRKFGEDIAFGIQQTAACWATDFIDPWVGEKIQHRFQDETHQAPKGSTWIGEIVGDSTAFFAFLGVQKFFPAVTRGLKSAARKLLNPMLERTGRKELKEWAGKENVRSDSPQYQQKMEEWKEFQSENIAKTAIISAGSIGFNVGTQKAMKNTHKVWVIALAKIAGASITVAGMLGMRFALPKTTRTFDEELSHRYFSPLIHKTQQLFGAAKVNEKTEPGDPHHIQQHRDNERRNDERHDKKSHTHKISERREMSAQEPVAAR